MIRILIADDHQIVRAGLKQFIAGEIDMQVTAEAASSAEALAAAARGGIDVVLLDISLPE
jgi:DNA-binding NarL/FixJ family response regulator